MKQLIVLLVALTFLGGSQLNDTTVSEAAKHPMVETIMNYAMLDSSTRYHSQTGAKLDIEVVAETKVNEYTLVLTSETLDKVVQRLYIIKDAQVQKVIDCQMVANSKTPATVRTSVVSLDGQEYVLTYGFIYPEFVDPQYYDEQVTVEPDTLRVTTMDGLAQALSVANTNWFVGAFPARGEISNIELVDGEGQVIGSLKKPYLLDYLAQ